MDEMKIIFYDSLYKNVMKFHISGNGPVINDSVRVNDLEYQAPPSREALSIYNFWFETIIQYIRKYYTKKPLLFCNNLDLLRYYYNYYSKSISNHKPWPFMEI